ncbi:MAG: LURP-one-related family protein [Bacillota bacterium]|nr:LURP-one-related family protein [Bacillota bacterium]
MKLVIQQKVFSWGDKFTVMDEYGNVRYNVQGEAFSIGNKLHIYDTAQNEVAFIRQKVFSFKPRFYVFQGENQVAEIVKEFTFFHQKYSISGLNWDTEGSFSAHDYSISENGSPIVSIHKKWFSWGDCYELDVSESANEIITLAVVLAIDCVMAADDN